MECGLKYGHGGRNDPANRSYPSEQRQTHQQTAESFKPKIEVLWKMAGPGPS